MGAKYTKGQAAATAEYMKNKHTIRVVVTKEKADEYKAAAEANGFPSLNKFIIDCVEKGINEREGKKMNLQTLDIRYLNEKAQRFFETSDGRALDDLFGECQSIEEINNTANDLYDEFFGEE